MTRQKTSHTRPDTADWLALLLGLAALALRLWDLGGPSAAFYDELPTLGKSLAPSWNAVVSAVRWQYPPSGDFQPPLYYLLVHAVLGLGHTDFFARLPAAFSGALSVPLLYLIGRRLGGRGVGLFAAAALAVSLRHMEASQQIQLTAFLGLVSLGAIWSALGATAARSAGQSARTWLAYAFFLALALYTSYLGVLAGLAGTGLMLLAFFWPPQPSQNGPPSPSDAVRVRQRGRKRRLVAGCLVASGTAATTFLPWLGATAGLRRELLLTAAPARPPLGQALSTLFITLAGRPELAWLLAGLVCGGVLAGLSNRRRRWGTVAALLWWSVCFGPVWLQTNAVYPFETRFLLPCLFPLLVLAAMVPMSLIEACLRPRSSEGSPFQAAVKLGLPVLLGLFLSWPGMATAPAERHEDSQLKQLAVFLREHAGPGMALAFLGNEAPWSRPSFETFEQWYLPGVFAPPLPQESRSYRQCLLVIPDGDSASRAPKEAHVIGRVAGVTVSQLALVSTAPVLPLSGPDGRFFFEADLHLPGAFGQIADSHNIRLDPDGLIPADPSGPGLVTYALAPLPGQKIALARLVLDAHLGGYPGQTPTGRVGVLVGPALDTLHPYDPGRLPTPGETLYVRLVLDPGQWHEIVRVSRLALGAKIFGRPSPEDSPEKEQQSRLAANTEIIPDAPGLCYTDRRPLLAAPKTDPPAPGTILTLGDMAYIDPLLVAQAPTKGSTVRLSQTMPGKTPLPSEPMNCVTDCPVPPARGGNAMEQNATAMRQNATKP